MPLKLSSNWRNKNLNSSRGILFYIFDCKIFSVEYIRNRFISFCWTACFLKRRIRSIFNLEFPTSHSKKIGTLAFKKKYHYREQIGIGSVECILSYLICWSDIVFSLPLSMSIPSNHIPPEYLTGVMFTIVIYFVGTSNTENPCVFRTSSITQKWTPALH